jgi:hypothetical protein
VKYSSIAKQRNLGNFLTGDESWFFWRILILVHYGVWAAFRDDIPETLMTEIDTEKFMISIIWSISGIHSLLPLTKAMKYKCNSSSFCQHIIPDIQHNICASSHRETLNDILRPFDNVPAQNLRLYSDKIESAKAERVSHLPYSPDAAPRDFFFGYLKGKLRGAWFTKSEDLVPRYSKLSLKFRKWY